MDPKLPPWIFSLPDLHEFPEGSLPSPYGLINPVRRLQPGLRLVAVGWLDGPIEFAKGPCDHEVVSKLLSLGEQFLIDEGTKGYHACYYCQPEDFELEDERAARSARRRGSHPWGNRPHSPVSKGHHLIRLGDVVYMCPALLPHYVVAHRYRPPDVFQQAVLTGSFLADGDLVHTGEDFHLVALQGSLAAAEAKADIERANAYRARIDARREELRLAGKTSGFRDPHTGVWRDERASVVSPATTSSTERLSRPALWPFDRILLDQPDDVTSSGRRNPYLAWLRKRLGG